ncbi:MAG: replication restart helicase PriA [Acholeplasmataceae bacterium]
MIIDLKVKELDQRYDYIVPKELEDLIQIGQRVVVSFGNMERLGYIVEILEKSENATKPIIEIVDISPIISDEMFLIYEYLKNHTTSLKSAILEAIIPSEFMHDYLKKAILIESFDDDIINKFNRNGEWILTNKDQKYYNKLKKLERNGKIKLVTTIKPRVKPKVVIGYRFNKFNNYRKIDKYIEVINLFKNNELILRSELLKITSISSLNTLEKNEVIIREDVIIKREIEHQFQLDDKKIILNQEQNYAYNQIKLGLNSTKEYLLFGVTGSGKTEVYLNVVEDVIKIGKTALILVPEINMIAQLAKRLKAKFNHVSIIHSMLTPGVKHDEYQKIYDGEAKIVLGTRSAIFAPLDNIGIIILDEEQDESYTQSESVIYETKELAKIRSEYHEAPIVYASATPKITTMHQAQNNVIELLELPNRAVADTMPNVSFINLKEELKQGHTSILSRQLLVELNNVLNAKEQAMILINRLGYSPFVMCRVCGYVPTCPSCGISLTYYQEDSILKCNYCGYHIDYENKCPNCLSDQLIPRGIGIEQVISELKKYFPKAKIIKLDHTTTRKKGAHEEIWYQFLSRDGDILVGTQMISKGFDFPDVILSAVILADEDLNLAKYNADETTYILLKQLIGRSGRHKPGKAIIQGYNLDHYAITSLDKDYMYFYKQALQNRKLANYPPYVSMSQIIISGLGYLNTYQHSYIIKDKLEENNFTVLGPTQAFILKKGEQYRFKLTIKHNRKDIDQIIQLIKHFNNNEFRVIYTPFIDLE